MREKFNEKFLIGIYLLMVMICILLNIPGNHKIDGKNILINAGMFIIVLLIFVWAYKIFKEINSLSEELKRASEQIKSDYENKREYLWDAYKSDDEQELFKQEKLSALYKDYLGEMKRLEELTDGGYRCSIEDYFNPEMIDREAKKNLLNLIPGAMTGMGILGTFIGLAFGLQEFNTGTSAEIESSIAPLMDGIKVAFHTSIYGMVFSLFFNLIYKNTLEIAYESLDEFLINYSKYVCPDAENDSFNYLLNLQQKQYQEFKNMPEVFGAAVGKNIDMTITPQFVKLNDNIEKFINKVGEAQIDSMGALVDKFMAQMNDTLKTSFVNLSNVINDTCEMQKQNNDYLQDTLSRVGKMTTDIQQINELSEKTVESLSAYVQEIETLQAIINQNFVSVNLQLEQNNKMEERQQEYIATLVEYEKQIGESSKKFSHDVSTQIELLEKMEKEISDRTNETLETLMEQAKEHSKALEEEAKEQMQGMNHVVQEIGAGLETFVENIKECSEEVTNEAKEQLQTVMKAAEMHNTVIAEAAKAEIESIQEMSVSTAGEMDQAAERLGSVTKDLNEKLSQSLNNTFDIFDQELSKIARHLSRTIGEIETTTSHVPEVVALVYENMEKSFEDMNRQMNSMMQLMDTVQNNISSMEKKLLEEEQRGTQDE